MAVMICMVTRTAKEPANVTARSKGTSSVVKVISNVIIYIQLTNHGQLSARHGKPGPQIEQHQREDQQVCRSQADPGS